VERQRVHSLWLAPVPFGLIAALGLAGWIAFPGGWPFRRRNLPETEAARLPAARQGALLLSLLVATNLATCLIFYVSSRYRLPGAVALLVLAGAGVDQILARLGPGAPASRAPERPPGAPLRTRAAGPAFWPGGLFMPAAVLLLAALLQRPLDNRHLAQEATLFTNTGSLLFDRREYAAALREYEAALALHPDHALAYLGAGSAHEALGQVDAARAAYRRALDLNGRLDAARRGLRRLGPAS